MLADISKLYIDVITYLSLPFLLVVPFCLLSFRSPNDYVFKANNIIESWEMKTQCASIL